MSVNHQIARITHSLFRELPYFGQNIILAHGQFNNCISSHLPTKSIWKSLLVFMILIFLGSMQLKPLILVMIILSTIVFRASTTLHIASTNLKLNFPDALVIHVFLFLRRNLEDVQVHLLHELNFDFSIIGVSETKIISRKN